MRPLFFEDNLLRTMQRHLDLASQRQSLISSNLSNVDTPGYNTVDLDFEKELQAAMAEQNTTIEVTHPRHLPTPNQPEGSGTPIQVENLPMRNDLNNVNVDREMALMAKNNLMFSIVSERIAGKFRSLKSAINSEGK